MSTNSYLDFIHFSLERLVLIDYLSLLLILVSFLYFQSSILRKVNKRSTFSRVSLSVANILLLFSIVGLITQPEFKSKVSEKLENITILTKTSNANEELLLNELEANRDSTFILHEVFEKSSLKNKFTSNMVISPSQLPLRISNNIKSKKNKKYTLEILGDGFTNQQIKSMSKFKNNPFQKIIYEPPTNKIAGLIKPAWSSKINLGEYFLFTSRIQLSNTRQTENGDGEKQFSVRLLNPSGQLEQEKQVIDGELISLKIVPKTFGLMTYKIELLKDNELISQENIAIEVTNQSSLKMLILQSSPSFETKQIKNWAGDNQAVVVVNTNITPKINLSRLTNVQEKNKKKYRTMNISESVLSDFDVLIIDSRRFSQLGTAHKKAIMNSIDDGLGVVLLVGRDSFENTLPFSVSDKGLLTISKMGKENQSILYIEPLHDINRTNRLLISDLPITHVANSFQFESRDGEKDLNNNSLIPLISNSKKEILVGQLKLGLGKVSYNLLKDTYRWISNGEQVAHSQLWQYLIKNTARNSKNSFQLINKSKRLIVGNKERLCVSTEITESELQASKIRSLSENKKFQILFNKTQTLENRYCASFWAETSGWHELTIGERNDYQSLNFYIYQKENWLADEQSSRINSTNKFREQNNNKITTITSNPTIQFRKFELWIYWMLIVSSLSFIWIERKYAE